MKKIQSAFTVAVLMGAAVAHGDDVSDQIAALKRQIQALEDKVDTLQGEQTAQQQKTANGPFITAGEEGFSLQSAHSNFVLNLRGFAQFDAHDYLSPAIGAKDTFTIRRLRAIASGTVYRDFEYYMQTDFASGITSSTTNNSFLQDAYLNVHHWDALQLQAGKFKEPVSMEVLPLDQYLWFLERGFPTELAPNRDVGVELHGNLWNNSLSYAAGVFNGVPDGGSGDVEVADNDKDAVFRLVGQPFAWTGLEGLKHFNLGLGGSWGLQAGSTTPTFGTVGRQTFYKFNSTVTETGEHLRLDPQFSYYWGPFCSYFEYIVSDEKFAIASKKDSANLQNSAWDLVGSYYLTGESNVFGVLPTVKNPFRFDGSGWGAFQLAARFGEIKLDPNSFPLYAAPGSASGATSWSVSLNWYLNRNVKCIFEYSQTAFSGDHTPKTVGAQDEYALLGRLQFGF